MALDVRETYFRDCSVHSYFSRVMLDALSVPPLGQVFQGFGRRFGRVFEWIFGVKMHENCKTTILAKPLKIMVFPKENTYFQGLRKKSSLKHIIKPNHKI